MRSAGRKPSDSSARAIKFPTSKLILRRNPAHHELPYNVFPRLESKPRAELAGAVVAGYAGDLAESLFKRSRRPNGSAAAPATTDVVEVPVEQIVELHPK